MENEDLQTAFSPSPFCMKPYATAILYFPGLWQGRGFGVEVMYTTAPLVGL